MSVDHGTCKLYFFNRDEVPNLQPNCVMARVIDGKDRCYHYSPNQANQNTVCQQCPQLINVQSFRMLIHL